MNVQDIANYLDTKAEALIANYVVETNASGEACSIVLTAHNGTTFQLDMIPADSGFELIHNEIAVFEGVDGAYTCISKADTLDAVVKIIEKWASKNA